MLDITKILSDKFTERLVDGFRSAFGDDHTDYENLIKNNAEQIIRLISGSNTLYHNVEHTIQVTLVGQAILQGKRIVDDSVTPQIWLNFIMSLLCHDIGYASGICSSDPQEKTLLRTSDAMLMSVHIDRGKQFVAETFSEQSGIEVEFIQECIERTRFPVGATEEAQQTSDFPGLVRGADLVGQVSDPRYINKLPAVFFEFEESGFNEITGYKQPGDLLKNYVDFYERSVQPYVQESVDYLTKTPVGRDILNHHDRNIALAIKSA
ncbi:MAG: metal-dependent phosphohydrolase [Gammaproteobacteria bacterium]